MPEHSIQDESALHTQLSQAREKLDGLVRDLQGIDRELENFSGERKQYGVLTEICAGLQQLEEMGAARLFWGESPAHGAEEQLRLARGRVDGFEKRIGEIEDRRQWVLEEIDQAQDESELLEDDLLELKRRAEEKKREWIVEREVDSFPLRPTIMPWARGGEDDQRFRKALAASLLLCLFLGLVFPLVGLPWL